MPRCKNIKLIGTVFLFSLAILLRIPELSRPLWNDEIISLRTLPVNLLQNPLFFGVTSNLPLFFYLLKIWVLVFNPHVVFQLRLLPLLLSLSTLLCWLVFLKKNFGYSVAFIFGIIYSVTPLEVYYSTEIRPYILVQLLLSMQTMSFYYYLTKKEYKYLIFLVILSILSLLTHYCSYFYFFSQGLILGIYFLYGLLKNRQISERKYFKNILICYFLLFLLSFCVYRVFINNPNFTRSIEELRISSDRSLSTVSKDINRIKEVFSMYYWYGLYYFYVDWPIQYVIKKILLIIFASTLILFLIKKNANILNLVKYVYPTLFLTLVTTLILENFGYYPFGGRHIMPFSVFYYAMVSLIIIKGYKIYKYFLVVLILLVLLFITFNLNLSCANHLELINEKVEIYRECLLSNIW